MLQQTIQLFIQGVRILAVLDWIRLGSLVFCNKRGGKISCYTKCTHYLTSRTTMKFSKTLLYGVSYLSLTSPMRQSEMAAQLASPRCNETVVFPVYEWCQGKLHNVWGGYVLVADNSTFPIWVAGWNVPWDGYLRVLCADRLQVPACISKSLLSAQCWWWRGSGCCVSDLSSSTPSSKAFTILYKAVLGYWLICKAVIFGHGMGLSHHYIETLVLYPSHILFIQWVSLLGEWC